MRIVLTGGGTAGHVLPNVAVIEGFKEKYPNTELLYIGSKNGPEKVLAEKAGVLFEAVACGKLRRYLSFENVKDFFRVPVGIFQARKILKEFKPDKVFSKGGFVSVPVCVAAWSLKIPVVLHESDFSPGLANRISAKFADTICVSFEESKKFFRKKNVKVCGNPVRKMIFGGKKEKGFTLTGFTPDKPVLLIMGGSLGAKQINDLTFNNLPELLKHCQVVHITGKGKGSINHVREKLKDYKQFEYLHEELADIYAITDLVVGRAGANTLAEISALGLPSVLIPLSLDVSRGDQIENAKIFEEKEMAIYLKDTAQFADIIVTASTHLDSFKKAENKAVEKIISLLI
jgi:UDP-N-acetylglucosamine--N-acetylmuramyl-(pentapeptide) pyrophosphoryl-undecaprenol N-acetylglucosamine transferase